MLVVNKIRGTFKSVAVKAPGFGDRRKAMLQDIAILTSEVISEGGRPQAGVDRPRAARPGPQGRHHQGRDHHRRGCGDSAGSRAGSTRSAPNSRRESSTITGSEERLAKLAGGVAVIKVGAATEVELEERKHRIEDAVRAAKVGPGGHRGRWRRRAGGRCRVQKLDLDGDERTGADTSSESRVSAPIRQIALNAGLEGGVVAEKVAYASGGSRSQRGPTASTATC